MGWVSTAASIIKPDATDDAYEKVVSHQSRFSAHQHVIPDTSPASKREPRDLSRIHAKYLQNLPPHLKTQRTMASSTEKPLGGKSYGHVPHLPGSRLGIGDHKISPGQARILTEKTRDKHDKIFVREKLDGSNVGVARVNGELIPLGRSGYRAVSSQYDQHRFFHLWVMEHLSQFEFLKDGERVCGEWLAQAHGTRYELIHEPFVVFDLMRGDVRANNEELEDRVNSAGLLLPKLLHAGTPLSIVEAMRMLEGEAGNRRNGYHGAIDPVEGAVWRVERKGIVDFLGKYVRTDKIDGKYLPEISGGEPIWHWRPGKK